MSDLPGSIKEIEAEDYLVGRGEMGALIRTIDWAATPVGQPSQWPQSLRTILSVCLASRFPMLIMWGPELIQFYNDAFRPILGATKHPRSMGQRGSECWAEIWEVVGPLAEGVLNTGQAVWFDDLLLVMDRNRYSEETYFTFSYSPIRDESGGVGGILVTCTETTTRVLGERRLRTLRDLGAQMGEGNTIEAAARTAAEILSQNPFDLPFALLYLLESEAQSARLVGSAGVDAGTPFSPLLIKLVGSDGKTVAWPLQQVAQTGQPALVDQLPARFKLLPTGPWSDPPHTALVLPIAAQAQDRPAGFLVSGLSPRRQLDDDYRSFLHLVAGHIATTIAKACAYEAERQRAYPSPDNLSLFTTEITERKLAKVALRRANERFEIAEMAARAFVYDYNVDTGEVERSGGLERVLGYREGEIPPIRGWWQQQIHPEDREQALRESTEAAEAGADWQSLEYRVRHKDGHYLWVWDRVRLIRDGEGRLVRRIGSTVDITERKQIEAEREQALAAERRQVEQLQALATAAIDLSAVNNLNTKLQIITERARTTIGAHRGVTSLVVDRNWEQAINVISLSEKYAKYRDYEVMPDGSGIYAFVCRTNRPVRLTQTELEAHSGWCGFGAEAGKHPLMRGWLAVPLIGRNGQNMGLIQLSDKYEAEFTEGDEAILIQLAHLAAEQIENAHAAEELARSEAALRASEAQLRALNQTLEQRVAERTAELQRSMQELDQFAYVASHDLKAPLRAIEHLASWIANDAGDVLPKASKVHLAKMQGRIQRMEKLLDDLLAYSRAGRDYYKEIEIVDIRALVEEVIDLLTPPRGFTITIQESMPTLATRRAPLELVFRNLISNAINHHHRPDGQVHISAHEAGPFIEFSVADNGPGIDEAFHERIFQMFQTLHPRDQIESSGMGLAVVKKVVESRGGTVKVISGEGKGATFKFTWPRH